jgi:hypothetical protein
MDTLDYAFKAYIGFFVFVIVYFCRWANQDLASSGPVRPPAPKAREVSPCRRPRHQCGFDEDKRGRDPDDV